MNFCKRPPLSPTFPGRAAPLPIRLEKFPENYRLSPNVSSLSVVILNPVAPFANGSEGSTFLFR